MSRPPIRLARPGEPKGQSLIASAVVNGGIRQGGRGMATLVIWSMAEASLGRPLGEREDGSVVLSAAVIEHAEWVTQSERTSWRDLEAFRAAFPGEEHPGRLAAELRAVRAVKQGQKEHQAMAAVGLVTIAA